MYKYAFLGIAMGILLTTSVTHAYAQGEEIDKPLVIKVKSNPFVSETFASPKPVPKNEVDQAKRHAVKGNIEKVPYRSDAVVSAYETKSPNWKYSGVTPGNYIETFETYHISSKRNVRIEFVQYSHTSEAFAAYQFRSYGYNSIEQGVYGDYSSESTSLTFYNVEPGYYKLRISNWGEQNLAGNGFTFY